MPEYLEGIALANFRGVGPDIQELGPFKTFNFFVGANNVGKSTVLDAIHRHFGSTTDPTFSELDTYTGQKPGPMQFRIGVLKETFVSRIHKLLGDGQVRDQHGGNHRLMDPANKICDQLSGSQGIIWLPSNIDESLVGSVRGAITDGLWFALWTNLYHGHSGGSATAHWIPQVLTKFFELQKPYVRPVSRFIPTHRQIGPTSQTFADFSGVGLIDRLAELQSPDHDKRHEFNLFEKINEFLQTVTGRRDARIEIPHNRKHVLVHMDNKVLPLANLGTGIHEVIMIAAFCTISQRQIVCIEEPESHLHPLLQRKLISYLQQKTSNQYFIATHSAAFIDTPGAAIFHVTNDGVQTRIKESILRRERFAICSDLGVRASDIVQSNYVVWVEGPSDRIYLRRWINLLAPDLLEGIHYSTMFYGGRLLSHLSADDEEVTEFISLRSLNQNLCVLIDSDRSSAGDRINDTKTRIVQELSKGGGKAWVTAGREIENYIEFERLQEAIKKLYSRIYHSSVSGGTYQHALNFYPLTDGGNRSSKIVVADKVKVARELVKNALDTNVLDLNDQLADLVDRIRLANE